MGNRRLHHSPDHVPWLHLTPPDTRPTADVQLGGRHLTALCPGEPMWETLAPHLNLDGTINASRPQAKTVVLAYFLAGCLDEQGVAEMQSALDAGAIDHQKVMQVAAGLIGQWWPLITLSC